VSTLDAARAGVTGPENLSPEMMQEVEHAEEVLKRRLPIGGQIAEVVIVRDLQKSVCTPNHCSFVCCAALTLCVCVCLVCVCA
jgi:hypothetical protein